MQLTNGCMWIWFADSVPTLVGFLQALRFSPTPKNQNPFIFVVHSFWSLSLCVQSLLGCLRFNYLCVRCSCHTAAPREPSGLNSRALQKPLIIIIILSCCRPHKHPRIGWYWYYINVPILSNTTFVSKALWYRTFKKLDCSLIWNFYRMYHSIHSSNCANFMKK